MIRFRLAELIADAQFKSGSRIKLMDIAEATGINRMTLSRMANQRGYSTSTDTIDKLCKYFGCQVGDVALYVEQSDELPAALETVDTPPYLSPSPPEQESARARRAAPRQKSKR